MENRRDFLKKTTILGGVLSGLSITPAISSRLSELHKRPQNGSILVFAGSGDPCYEPLDEILLTKLPESEIRVIDGEGIPYIRSEVNNQFSFRAGGAGGNQLVILSDEKGEILDMASFRLQSHTFIEDEGGYYHKLLNTLYFSMVREFGASDTVRINNRFYTFFVRWLRDHVHTLKGMKYFHQELKSGIELYSDLQREDGMIWDNIYPRT
jgi:hypothetical protein